MYKDDDDDHGRRGDDHGRGGDVDDPQGTAATVLSGLYGAMKVQGLGPESLKDQVHPLYSG